MMDSLRIDFLEYLRNALTVMFLIIVISYYFLFLIKKKKITGLKKFSSISVIVPAHNEEQYIKECLDSVLNAEFSGFKETIVIDDGSKDSTRRIVLGYKKKNVHLIKTRHIGKSASINLALKHAKGNIIAIVDGDSVIHKDALESMVLCLSDDDVAAATGVIRVKNRKKIICMWVHIELLFNSLMRSLFSRINANIVTPGPLSMYKKQCLVEVGGFSTEGFSEDVDVTIRLIRKGYKVAFADSAVAETNMPYKFREFFNQRVRFARGLVNILKRHMRFEKKYIDAYALPLLLFNYLQGVIMGLFIFYQIISGYYFYFISKGTYFNFYVLKYFFEWFSIVGFVRWAIEAFSGQSPMGFMVLVGIVSTLLSYPLYFIAICKFDRKLNLLGTIPIFFMFPFWLLIMLIYIIAIPEFFRKGQYNIWKKNG